MTRGPSRIRADEWAAVPAAADLRLCVTVPARNEERRLPRLLRTLADQRDRHGRPLRGFETLVLVNGSGDRSAAVARAWMRRLGLSGAVLERPTLPAPGGVGSARRLLMDVAVERLDRAALLRGQWPGEGVVVCTDADCRVPRGWLQRTMIALRDAAAVAGRVVVEHPERSQARRLHRRRFRYHAAIDRLRRGLHPDPLDPGPGHHFACGASLAVRTWACRLVGGMPPLAYREDVAFWHALKRAGCRVRHDRRVWVRTSGRTDGRCPRGLAGQLRDLAGDGGDWLTVECPTVAFARLAGSAGLHQSFHRPVPLADALRRLERDHPWACESRR